MRRGRGGPSTFPYFPDGAAPEPFDLGPLSQPGPWFSPYFYDPRVPMLDRAPDASSPLMRPLSYSGRADGLMKDESGATIPARPEEGVIRPETPIPPAETPAWDTLDPSSGVLDPTYQAQSTQNTFDAIDHPGFSVWLEPSNERDGYARISSDMRDENPQLADFADRARQVVKKNADQNAGLRDDRTHRPFRECKGETCDAGEMSQAFAAGVWSVVQGNADAIRFVARATGMMGHREQERFEQEAKVVDEVVNRAAKQLYDHPELITETLKLLYNSPGVVWDAIKAGNQTLNEINDANRNGYLKWYMTGRLMTSILFAPAGVISTIGGMTRAVERGHDLTDALLKGGVLGNPEVIE